MNHNGGYDGQYIVIAIEESLSPNLPIAGHSTTTFATENHQSKALCRPSTLNMSELLNHFVSKQS